MSKKSIAAIVSALVALSIPFFATPAHAEAEVKKGKVFKGKKAVETMKPGTVFKDCQDCPEMVVMPPGSFEMGSNHRDSKKDEQPVHSVRIGKAFALGKTEVTQGQWRAVMGNNPSVYVRCGDSCPVDSVGWNDAQEFVRKMSKKTGKTYRLPSEAEWEYACLAGGTQTFCGDDSLDSVAWSNKYMGGDTHEVAGKQANAWGLHDMSGNVSEWTEDCWNNSYSGAPSDGSAWTSGDCSRRVDRGGSISENRYSMRATRRSSSETPPPEKFKFLDEYSRFYGFRVARMLP